MDHKSHHRRFIVSSVVLLFLIILITSVLIFRITRRPQQLPSYASQIDLPFQEVAQPGFDADGQARKADSAWSMRYFEADGADNGYIYVGTDNNIIGLSLSEIKPHKQSNPPVESPQIRRYRPDLGSDTWEVVFDLQRS